MPHFFKELKNISASYISAPKKKKWGKFFYCTISRICQIIIIIGYWPFFSIYKWHYLLYFHWFKKDTHHEPAPLILSSKMLGAKRNPINSNYEIQLIATRSQFCTIEDHPINSNLPTHMQTLINKWLAHSKIARKSYPP